MLTQTQFKSNIKQNYLQLFKHYEKNKLIIAINYSFNFLEESLLKKYCKLFNFVINTYSINNKLLTDLITFFLCSLISLTINYDLKHMLHKFNHNGVPCLHQIYGENISQLVSFSLFIESNRLILRNHIDYEKKQSIFSQIQNSKINKNLIQYLQIITDQNKKNLLETDFLFKKKILLADMLKIINILINKTPSDISEYEELSEFIFDNKQKKIETENSFIQKCYDYFQ